LRIPALAAQNVGEIDRHSRFNIDTGGSNRVTTSYARILPNDTVEWLKKPKKTTSNENSSWWLPL